VILARLFFKCDNSWIEASQISGRLFQNYGLRHASLGIVNQQPQNHIASVGLAKLNNLRKIDSRFKIHSHLHMRRYWMYVIPSFFSIGRIEIFPTSAVLCTWVPPSATLPTPFKVKSRKGLFLGRPG